MSFIAIVYGYHLAFLLLFLLAKQSDAMYSLIGNNVYSWVFLHPETFAAGILPNQWDTIIVLFVPVLK